MASPSTLLVFRILDLLPLGALVLRSDWTVVFWNTRLESWTKSICAEVLGRDLRELYPRLASNLYADRVGLSVCRKAAMRHGGRIWVEPTPGGGAHFRFTLGVASTVAAGTFTPTDSEVSSA